jgi:uncharacterized SAM-binding protein YcdF (DUF218 family)
VKKRQIVLVSTVVLAIVLGVWFVTTVRGLRELTISAWEKDVTADCAVLLTGGRNRVRKGFDLLARGSVKKLIISGVDPRATLREIFPQWPYYGPLNEKDVVLEKHSRTTWGNAQQSLVLVEALYCRDIVLVTSYIHMPRAKKTFKSVFPESIPIYEYGVTTSFGVATWTELTFESIKAMFYAIWAY